ncbi:hypothetical protein EOS_09230 [Caballeronia mineralivorans PML1(12)]|uniref:DUF637 domain-containing protein n=1 Tax=Caballeronia mineralivorans PML1(12) TaxID=908627 RepID=A0A0J1G2T8_9BURK|nr:hypothetical protein EOS_09230 [Caballeronia mineralivorans PML1(12)]
MLGEAGISAGVGTAIEGGSFGNALKDALTQEAAAAGAFAIGTAGQDQTSFLAKGTIGYNLAHAALGCAAGGSEWHGVRGWCHWRGN